MKSENSKELNLQIDKKDIKEIKANNDLSSVVLNLDN